MEDAMNLLGKTVPMPGTLLNPRNGVPEVVPTLRYKGSREAFRRTFPNRMIRRALSGQLLPYVHNPGIMPTKSMATVQSMIQSVLASELDLRYIDNAPMELETWLRGRRLAPAAQFGIRKMMSCYWENFSPFGLDLTGAVMRQGVFVDKMVKIDWLHSPSAPDTMARLISKYERFIDIMAKFPMKTAVPTLDIDLAWHTHQLKPHAYFAYTTRKTGRFINHDDKIEETKLGNAFEWTSKVYQAEYGEVYSECSCWYCEGELPGVSLTRTPSDQYCLTPHPPTPLSPAVRASHVSSVGRFLGLSRQDKSSSLTPPPPRSEKNTLPDRLPPPICSLRGLPHVRRGTRLLAAQLGPRLGPQFRSRRYEPAA